MSEVLGRVMTWLFSAVSVADMVVVLFFALKAQVWNEPQGFIYVFPAFYVPILIVLQAMIVMVLLRQRSAA